MRRPQRKLLLHLNFQTWILERFLPASKLFLVLLIFIYLHSVSRAEDSLAYTSSARTHLANQASLLIKSVGHSCLSMTLIVDDLPCNPAFTPLAKNSSLSFQFLLSNGYSNLETTRQLFKKTADYSSLQEFLKEKPVIQIESVGEMFFRTSLVSGKYTPLNQQLFSVVRNVAYPRAALRAKDESNLVLQSGFSIQNRYFLGAKIISAKKRYIMKTFDLFDLGTESGRNLLDPQNVDVLYFEPGIGYISNNLWNFHFSAVQRGLGYSKGDGKVFEMKPQTELGFSVSPPTSWGKMQVGIDYKKLGFDDSRLLHLGILYQLGSMTTGFGADEYGISWGVMFYLKQLYSGILFTTTRAPWNSSEFYTDTIYTQLGVEL